MPKKLVLPTEKFIVVDSDGDLQGSWPTLKLAQDYVELGEMDGAIIYRVTHAWEARFPEEPELEFLEVGLINV